MLPVVVVDVPAEAPRDLVEALVTACTNSFSNGTCVTAGSQPKGESPPSAVVIVSVETNGMTFHLELGVQDKAEQRWLSRDLSFEHSDPPSERWTSVGLIIGTWVHQSEQASASKSDAQDKRPSDTGASAPATVAPVLPLAPPSNRPPGLDTPASSVERGAGSGGSELAPFLGGALLAGPAPGQDQLRMGAKLQAGLFALDVLAAFVGVGFEHTVGEGRFSAQWVNAHVGGLMRPILPITPVFLEVWGAGGLRQVTGRYEHLGNQSSVSLLDPLVLGGIDVGISWTAPWEMWLGGGLMSNDRPTRFFVDESLVGREPTAIGFVELGLRGRWGE